MTLSLSRRAVMVLPALLTHPALAADGFVTSDGYELEWSFSHGSLDVSIVAPTTGWFALALGPDRTLRAGRRVQMLATDGTLTVREQGLDHGHPVPASTPIVISADGTLIQGRSHASLRFAPWATLASGRLIYAGLSWSRLRSLGAAPNWERIVPIRL